MINSLLFFNLTFSFSFRIDDSQNLTISATTATEAKIVPASQRNIALEDHDADLKVTESMQNFVYKKLSKLIDESVEFVDVGPPKTKRRKVATDATVKLLRDTQPIDLDAVEVELDVLNQVRPVIARRTVEPDTVSEEERIKASAIDINQVTASTQHWKEKKGKDRKLFKYKEKNAALYQIDTTNEFTKLRKKNNWCETKIAKFKHTNLRAE